MNSKSNRSIAIAELSSISTEVAAASKGSLKLAIRALLAASALLVSMAASASCPGGTECLDPVNVTDTYSSGGTYYGGNPNGGWDQGGSDPVGTGMWGDSSTAHQPGTLSVGSESSMRCSDSLDFRFTSANGFARDWRWAVVPGDYLVMTYADGKTEVFVFTCASDSCGGIYLNHSPAATQCN
jgi:hypothetical protein